MFQKNSKPINGGKKEDFSQVIKKSEKLIQGSIIPLKEIRQKIIDWQNNKISKEDLQKWAESTKESKILFKSNLSERDEFIGLEVLHYLEFMNIDKTIKEDIPLILNSLKIK